jgi:predicted alpha/beta-hydrolase family hydrolase
MLFVQGSRDTFGTPGELAPVLSALTPPATLHVVAGGDHSFKVPKLEAHAQAAVYDDVQRTIVEWMRSVLRPDLQK